MLASSAKSTYMTITKKMKNIFSKQLLKLNHKPAASDIAQASSVTSEHTRVFNTVLLVSSCLQISPQWKNFPLKCLHISG